MRKLPKFIWFINFFEKEFESLFPGLIFPHKKSAPLLTEDVLKLKIAFEKKLRELKNKKVLIEYVREKLQEKDEIELLVTLIKLKNKKIEDSFSSDTLLSLLLNQKSTQDQIFKEICTSIIDHSVEEE